ncbi:MAG: arginine deiminase-related protein [Gemmatimonadetes bacterium]|nr:arginine deiminase-related protein [Gemmatimonadota bacterium]
MIRPARFGSNPATAASNRFQFQDTGVPPHEAQSRALAEFEGVAAALAGAGVEVCVVDDTPEPAKPDAVFPNNWVSFHADGTVVLYPMLAESRRQERREEILSRLVREHGFRITRTIDLSWHERDERYLEGTGSLVLDRPNRLAFACLSPRTHLDALGDFAQQLDYEVVSFDAVDACGVPIYHTNVLLCLGESFAVLCGATIRDESRRAALLRIIAGSGHDTLDITLEQMTAFAGNMLELRSRGGEPIVVLSARALDALTREQRSRLEHHGRLLVVSIPTIERYGGGSVRCMLAEVHLPRRD